MDFIVFLIAILLPIIIMVLWSICIAASNADDMAEEMMREVECVPLNTELPGDKFYIIVHRNAEDYVEWFVIKKFDESDYGSERIE